MDCHSHTGRQGSVWGGGRAEAAFGSRPTSGKAEAIGRDWHTPRLGRGSGAALKAGTDDAPDPGGAQEPPH